VLSQGVKERRLDILDGFDLEENNLQSEKTKHPRAYISNMKIHNIKGYTRY
jgi:hypothetical protein